ncbi:MAG: rhodanese-like domain-containing protein [Candidatus Thermoplasmatota archaeon]
METISAEKLKEKMDAGEDFMLVHVLSEEQFRKEHIPDSINIPLGEIGRRKNELDPNKEIILYCESFDCEASPKAAEKLEKLGFRDVVDYEGGMKDWKKKGYPVVSSAD